MWRPTILAWLALPANSVAQFGIKHTQYGTSPPVYPSPNITGIGGWEEALEKARAFVAELTLEEKADMVTGTPGPCVGNIAPIPRLNFTGLCLQDGPNALRQALYVNVFPSGVTAGASWDRKLVHQQGVLMGEEFRGKGSHVLLGPVIGALGRSPFAGRNWEGFSPDAYLSGELVGQNVIGIQAAGVQACTKHFILNEQEIQRHPTTVNGTRIEALSSNVDDKTMHETYLWPFYNAVHAGTASIMCSYNRINGSYGCQNSKTLNGLLKEELGFQGWVASDWRAAYAGVASINAGLDMNMPGGLESATALPSYWGPNLTAAVTNGSLAIERVDDMILRILTPYYKLNQHEHFPRVDRSSQGLSSTPLENYVHEFSLGPIVDVRSDHAKHIRELGAAGTVLLKNTNSTLPLKKPQNIGVFGNDAADLTEGLYTLFGINRVSYGDYEIGTLPVGGGAGTGRFSYVVSPLDAIKSKAHTYGADVQYIISHRAIASGSLTRLYPTPEVCLVFLKTWAAEGSDRTTLVADWNSTATVEAIAARCPNTVVVLHGAAPNIIPFRDNPNVTAILAAHFPGQETGHSIVDILWGDVNPSGRLPYTIANQDSDYAWNIVNSTELKESTDPDAWQADFTERNLIDYKEFDSYNKSVAYEFGFGLSYTTFDILDVSTEVLVDDVSRTPSPDAPILPGGNVELWSTLVTVNATVKNTGSVSGAAVPQLYISLPDEAGEGNPVRSLRGFDKISIDAGESATVSFPLMRRDLSYWDVVTQSWTLPTGTIGVYVGFSSRDLKWSGEIVV
ncbi:avenacinase [Corynespora cassiicola Philippines]|uniref:Probable beta-glucosidase G n=1 Tax=Corynespora cassiicola Philippines TaxID=1448308 RepID=A0A2T2NKB2_CORCC|nr:avenacinase [Corynespora cassiicola Philippines]